MTTLEQIKAAVRTLPPDDRRGLQQWLQEQEQRDNGAMPPAAESAAQPANGTQPAPADSPRPTETVEQQIARFRKAMDWIKEHRAEYLGQWVVLVGDQLISHGPDSKSVFDRAKAVGIETPFLEQVLEEEKAFCGGWQ